ncbi:phage head-tail connector protein [Bradyrhizobium sp. SRS-191]|uniref:phage head-tail connector protein n=1 Tax=Bradyrhizobium sp. SRS-191 TaxID=2962606 RepID=UPI00211DB666|nr:phage head-tail connector protein [Bradyrhizobium sp. SRS-191]
MPLKIITTVVSAPVSTDLVTLDVVKQELDITDTSGDTVLTRYVKSASKAALQYCNRRTFAIETLKDDIRPDRDPVPRVLSGLSDVLQLSMWPVKSIASLTEDGTALVAGTDYLLDAAVGQLIRLNAAGDRSTWNIKPKLAQYDAGFDAVPDDVADAVIRMVTSRWLNKGVDQKITREDIPGVRSYQRWVATGADAGNMPPDITDLLDNYRVPVIA